MNMSPSMICSLSSIHEGYSLSLGCTVSINRYIEMLIAIPTLGYLRLYR